MRVIILGTGRCGTHSTIELLKANQFDAVHERFAHICWERSPWPHIHIANSTHKWADAGFYYLPYVQFLASEYPDVKFVCLKRDREEVIASFLNHMPNGLNWFQAGGPKDHWFDKFPTFPSVYTLSEAIGAYWDMYNKVSARLESEILRFKVFSTDSLNSVDGVVSILDFVGVPRNQQVVATHIREDQKRLVDVVDDNELWPRPW